MTTSLNVAPNSLTRMGSPAKNILTSRQGNRNLDIHDAEYYANERKQNNNILEASKTHTESNTNTLRPPNKMVNQYLQVEGGSVVGGSVMGGSGGRGMRKFINTMKDVGSVAKSVAPLIPLVL